MSRVGRMLVVAPCLLVPYLVYRGAGGKELAAASALRGLLCRDAGLALLSYPCPEFILLGFPRPPAPREVYERLGMREVAGKVAAFIERVVAEERPAHLVLVGVRGSPTCAAHTTSSGSPEEYPYHRMEGFKDLEKGKRFALAREIARGFLPASRPGILFELVKERVEGTYLDFDKDDVQGSMGVLEAALFRGGKG